MRIRLEPEERKALLKAVCDKELDTDTIKRISLLIKEAPVIDSIKIEVIDRRDQVDPDYLNP